MLFDSVSWWTKKPSKGKPHDFNILCYYSLTNQFLVVEHSFAHTCEMIIFYFDYVCFNILSLYSFKELASTHH